MQKFYFFVHLAICICTVFPNFLQAQQCNTLSATFASYESRCAATGSIKVFATGGSGSYKYKTTGAVNSNFTTSDSLTGLSAGTYDVVINDITTNCTFTLNNVVVAGTYQDPRFTLSGINVSCDNGSNGSIAVNGQQYGRSPFSYMIVAPSPMGIGTTNNTGMFSNLVAGDYYIRLTDSCGGIQTRSITINNYTWWIDAYSFNKVSCDSATGFVKVVDSRGNVSTLGGIPGFTYGIVRFPGDTIWSADPDFYFNLPGTTTIDILARDACGTIKKGNTGFNFSQSVGANVIINNKTCNTFTAALTSVINFFNADFCLYDVNNVLVACNTTGVFNNLPYGDYHIKAHDLCPDTTIIRWFTASPPSIAVGSNVNTYDKNCTSFSASITGQAGLTNPIYCLIDSVLIVVACNNNGTFNNIPYGNYCIQIKDNCRDTTIFRCINVLPPRPVIPAVITPSYTDCNNVRIIVGGDSLFSPQFCLYNSSGILITCNSTGIFDSLLVGNQCVTIYDSCYDTTITRCFTVGVGLINNDLSVSTSNYSCSTFTVQANSSNITSAQYCLYTQSDSLITCNTNGVFNNVLFGSYCIKVRNACPDTLFTHCFSVSPLIPVINKNVSISNRECATFKATITGQQNLTDPLYCLFDSNDVQLSCNSIGSFDSLLYGTYCIKTINSCYDTTIIRCFTVAPKAMGISLNTSKSCSYGYATIGISIDGGTLPVNVKIYNPNGTILLERVYNSRDINIDSIPGMGTGATYTVIATDLCGNMDSLSTGVTASIANHSATVFAQCPSAAWQNGSGKIQLNTVTNMGVFTVRIIKKDNVLLNPALTPNSVAGGIYTYNDMGTGTYIVRYKLNDICDRYLYDTVTVAPYFYPNLNRSSAYQCDVSGFSVGAVATNGVGPFSYEIIGSNPSFPSINAGPQASPVFNINNGINYSLIRLRALDACGNATLGDASILPLANFKIIADSNCFQSSSTLAVDTIYNATYAWFKKDKYNSTDSIYLGAGYTVHIPYLSANDTGTYICYVDVNTGCVKRSFAYNLNGLCYGILPVKLLDFSGNWENGRVRLNWKSLNETNLTNYILERGDTYNNFKPIGSIKPVENREGLGNHAFFDENPSAGKNQYRLKLNYADHSYSFSNIVLIGRYPAQNSIQCYPNPVTEQLSVVFDTRSNHFYRVSILNIHSQVVFETGYNTANGNTLQIAKPKGIGKGMYTLRCIDVNTNEIFTQKIIFQ